MPRPAHSSAPIVASPFLRTPPHPSSPPAPLMLDWCRAEVVLRGVMLVHVHLLILAALLDIWRLPEGGGWMRAALVVGCSLPATLLWLVVMCLSRPWGSRLSHNALLAASSVWGGVCGLLAGALLGSVVGTQAVPWPGAALFGALMALELALWMLLRARLQAPGDVAAQLSTLQARIRPHFLFNTLNSAIALVQTDPHKAEAVLEDMSDLFRHMLRDTRHSSTLGEELELAQRYLHIEQVRFGARMRVRWKLEPAANLAAMPPLVLQPLIENAVKHGVEPSAEGATIRIATALRGNMVEVTVTNTCPATPSAPSKPGTGMALHNVRQRLALLHDMELHFSAKRRNNRFVVHIQVPMQLNDAAPAAPHFAPSLGATSEWAESELAPEPVPAPASAAPPTLLPSAHRHAP